MYLIKLNKFGHQPIIYLTNDKHETIKQATEISKKIEGKELFKESNINNFTIKVLEAPQDEIIKEPKVIHQIEGHRPMAEDKLIEKLEKKTYLLHADYERIKSGYYSNIVVTNEDYDWNGCGYQNYNLVVQFYNKSTNKYYNNIEVSSGNSM